MFLKNENGTPLYRSIKMGNGSSEVWVGSGDDRHRDFEAEHNLKQARKRADRKRDEKFDRDQWEQKNRMDNMGGRTSTAHTSVVSEPTYPGYLHS